MARVTAAAGQSGCTRPSRRPRMRGKRSRASSTACRLATGVLPRARAWASRASQAALGEHRIEGGDRLVRQDQVRLLVEHPGDADPLQLAARRLAAALLPLVGEAGQASSAQHRRGSRGRSRDQEAAGDHWPRRPASTAVTTGWGRRAAEAAARSCRSGCAPLAGPGGEGPGILAPEGELALAAQLGGDQPQQAGLARAARPDDGPPFPAAICR